jgi:hypothetical protein
LEWENLPIVLEITDKNTRSWVTITKGKSVEHLGTCTALRLFDLRRNYPIFDVIVVAAGNDLPLNALVFFLIRTIVFV